METNADKIFTAIWRRMPAPLRSALGATVRRQRTRLFIAGGTIRDEMLGRPAGDLDLFVPGSSRAFARCLQSNLGGGSFIDLSVPEEEAARIVWHDRQVDVSSPRFGARTVEEDLWMRDFSINAMAIEVADNLDGAVTFLDPADGRGDLRMKILRHLPDAFVADPLRMLRGYRFAADLGFTLAELTRQQIHNDASLIVRIAVERVDYELQHIFRSGNTTVVLRGMTETDLLRYIIPELFMGEGVEQPEFHHLDVMEHGFATLEWMERILAAPGDYFSRYVDEIESYIKSGKNKVALKWAALLHDVGKPETKALREEDGRVTFHRHDEVGVDIFQSIANRLKWGRALRDRTGGLIGAHMHPFHLCNVQREAVVSKKAALKLHRRIGDDMIGLFLLAMADSLASEGVKKPEKMEDELRALRYHVIEIYQNDIKPVVAGPRLVSGHDVMKVFGLESGPQIGEILEALESSRVENPILDKDAALSWISGYLDRSNGQKR